MNERPVYFVLVADDDAGIRKLIRAMLAPLDLEIVEAADGRQAIELARRVHCQVAIVDLIMPEMDGIEVTRELRRLRRDIGIIVVSGVLAEQLEIARRLGSDAIITKPIDQAELLAIVRRLLERATPPDA